MGVALEADCPYFTIWTSPSELLVDTAGVLGAGRGEHDPRYGGRECLLWICGRAEPEAGTSVRVRVDMIRMDCAVPYRETGERGIRERGVAAKRPKSTKEGR